MILTQEFYESIIQANERLYNTKVTQRILRSWVDAGIIPPSKAVGVKRGVAAMQTQSIKNYRQALYACKMYNRGYKRKSQLRLMLWFESYDICIHYIKNDLISEHTRNLNKLQKRFSTFPNHQECDNITPRQQQTILKQAGEIDDTLKNACNLLDGREVIRMIGYNLSGHDNEKISSNIIDPIFANHRLLRLVIKVPKLKNELELWLQSGSGLMGTKKCTDNSVSNIMDKVTEQRLEVIRQDFSEKILQYKKFDKSWFGKFQKSISVSFYAVNNQLEFRLTIFLAYLNYTILKQKSNDVSQ